MNLAPIKLSAEAESHLRLALAETAKGTDAALVWSPHICDGKEIPAVILGWYAKGSRPKASFFNLCGYAVSIMPTTLEHIADKTISRDKFGTKNQDGPLYFHILTVT